MITPEDIKLQLMTALPLYTDIFGSVTVGVASVNSTASAINIVKEAHGLSDLDVIMVTEAIVKVPITAVSLVDGELTLTTSFYHDRTSGSKDIGGYNKAVLEGFASTAFNAEFDILEIPAKNSFIIASETAPTSTLGYLVEPRSLFLGPQVVTKIDDNTFSIPRSDLLPANTVFTSFEYSSSQEIRIAADIKRAVTEYAKRQNPLPRLYVIMGPEKASKDRNTQSDAVTSVNSQNPARMTYLTTVDLLACFKVPPEDIHLAAATQQKVYEELSPALRQAMYGHVFEFADKSITAFAAIETFNSPIDYNIGYYLHSFTFEMPYSITLEQGDMIRRNVSFRDIVLKSKMFNNDGQEVEDDFALNP